jgi:hypothetical protein
LSIINVVLVEGQNKNFAMLYALLALPPLSLRMGYYKDAALK